MEKLPWKHRASKGALTVPLCVSSSLPQLFPLLSPLLGSPVLPPLVLFAFLRFAPAGLLAAFVLCRCLLLWLVFSLSVLISSCVFLQTVNLKFAANISGDSQ